MKYNNLEIINKPITQDKNEHIGRQTGFVPGKGTKERCINVRQIIEKFYEYHVPAVFCFLDYTKASDTVEWDQLWRLLQEIGTPRFFNSQIIQ